MSPPSIAKKLKTDTSVRKFNEDNIQGDQFLFISLLKIKVE